MSRVSAPAPAASRVAAVVALSATILRLQAEGYDVFVPAWASPVTQVIATRGAESRVVAVPAA